MFCFRASICKNRANLDERLETKDERMGQRRPVIIKMIIMNRIMRGRHPPRFCRLRHTLPLLRVSNADPQRPAFTPPPKCHCDQRKEKSNLQLSIPTLSSLDGDDWESSFGTSKIYITDDMGKNWLPLI